jgi:hypothetical protein
MTIFRLAGEGDSNPGARNLENSTRSGGFSFVAVAISALLVDEMPPGYRILAFQELFRIWSDKCGVGIAGGYPFFFLIRAKGDNLKEKD